MKIEDIKKLFLKRPVFLLGLILVIGLAVRLIYLWEVSGYSNFKVPYAGLDVALYHNLAQSIASGDLFLGKEAYYFSPLYAYFLGGLYYIFGDSYLVARLANIALGVGTIALIYLYTLKLFRSTGVALITALGAALYGPFLVFDTSGLKTTLGQFLISLSLVLICRANQKREFIPWLYTGGIIGLAFNMNGQLGLFFIGILLWLFVTKPIGQSEEGVLRSAEKWPRRLGMAGCLFLGLVIALLPFTIRNYFVTKDVVLTTSTSGIHFYIGNNKRAWGGYRRITGIRPNPAGHYYDARRVAERSIGHPLSASEVSAFWKDKAWDFIGGNLGAFLSLLGKKALLVLNAYEIPNNENYQYLTKRSFYLSLFPCIVLLLPLGLSGLLISLPQWRRLTPLLVFFFSYALGVIISIVTWRYRLPLALGLLPWSGFFVVRAITWARDVRFLALGLVAVLLFGCWAITKVPLISKKNYDWSMKRAEAIMNACEQEETLLKQIATHASGLQGDVGHVWLKLARIRESQYDIEGAIRILRQGLDENPNQPRLWHRLSIMLSRLGDMEGARKAEENLKRYRLRRPPERAQ